MESNDDNDECGYWLLYRGSLLLVIHLAVLSVTANVILVRAVLGASLIDNNVKWLLGNISLASCIIALHCGIRSLVRIFQSCPSALSNVHQRTWTDCALEELIYTIALLAMALSICFVGSERLSATMRKNYEETDGCIGYMLATISWFLSSAMALVWLANTVTHDHPIEDTVSYCMHILIGPDVLFYGFLCVLLLVPAATVCVYGYLYWTTYTTMYKFGINLAAPLDLGARFEIRCNLDFTRMMLPSVVLHTCCCVLLLPVLLVLKLRLMPARDNTWTSITINVIYSVILLYSFCHCLIVLYMSRSARRALNTFCTKRAAQPSSNNHLTVPGASNDYEYPVVNFRRSPEDYNDMVTMLWNSIDQEQESV